MKKITSSLLLIISGFFGLTNKAQAQSDAILVPTYQSRSEMPARMKPEQKLLLQLPIVIVNENGTDLELFESEMNTWISKNETVKTQLDKSIIELIDKKQFEEITAILIEMGHSKELSLASYKGGKHE